jgi:predicted nucleotide-binding protein (sugar kinase/HSP70/actin superfamily)
VDGTAYVRDAIEKLKKDGFEIELVELNKTPYKKTLALYASADVYVGKLRMGYYNNANIESMLLGVPCISYIRPELREKHCPECPIIQATPETVYETLKSYINRRDELKIIGKKSRKFILEAHKDEYSIIPLIETYKNLLKAS